MMLVDANLLLYAYHPKSEQHKASRAWLEAALSGAELVRFAWFTLWAFLRISTNPRVFERPLSITESRAAISSWLDQPVAGVLEPGDRLGMPEGDVVIEIERYLVQPGQALAYKIGMMKILELRDRAKGVLGSRFDLREFHDVVLRNGAMPLAILERVVDDYGARKKIAQN